jgi:hypothetical protein
MAEAKTAAPKKTAAKKPAAKKSAAKKPTGARKATRAVKPMTEHTRAFAARVTGSAVEAALSNENLGVKRSGEKELTGKRTGMVSRIVLDDGSTITVTVAVRQK